MRRLLAWTVAAAIPLAGVLALATATPALAHERRTVGGYQLVVGWGDEPVYSGAENSVQVSVSEAGGGPPVTDLGDTLKIELIKGADRTTLPLVANFRVGAFGTPGDYRAWVTPTRPGTYTVHLSGTIRGQVVDESFTSSPTTFDDVEDATASEFPVKDPSTGQLAARLDREIARLERRAATAGDARTLAVVGVLAGGLGIAVGAAALVVASRATRRGKDGRAGRPGREAPPEQAGTLTR